MKNEPFIGIADYYDRLVEQYGHDPRACDYGRPESQAIKFQVIANALDFTDRSVLDVGCGFADFAGFLTARFRGVRYVGIDLSPRMIEQARALRPGLDLRMGNILEVAGDHLFDIVTANGIFYLLGPEATTVLPSLIRRMFALAKIAVVFNSLSSWTPLHEADEFHADPLEVVAFCRTLTPWVVLRHDYHARDFTISLYRERNTG